MATRPKLDLWLIAILFAPVFAGAAPAQELADPLAGERSTIEIEYRPEALLPYRLRRGSWGPLLGFRYETFIPSAYESPYDGNTYDALFGGEGLQMMGLQAGAKYNLPFASISAELSYHQGGISDSRIGDDVSLRVSRTGFHAGLWLDMLWLEPYVVPYVQADVYMIDFEESDSQVSESGTAGPGFGYTAGLLIQLNKLDERASLEALANSGLQNTYLDLFITQFNGSGGETDFAGDLGWGAGLRLEF